MGHSLIPSSATLPRTAWKAGGKSAPTCSTSRFKLAVDEISNLSPLARQGDEVGQYGATHLGSHPWFAIRRPSAETQSS